MSVLLSILIFVFCAVVILCMVVFLVIDMRNKVDDVQKIFPKLVPFFQRRESLGILVLVCILMF
jgi:hypothetical protein